MNRRDFIKLGGLGAMAFLVSKCGFLADDSKTGSALA